MLIFAAYGKVFLVRKIRGPDRGHLYAMKVSITHLSRFVPISTSFQVLKKANIVQKKKTTEHTRTERQVSSALSRKLPILGIPIDNTLKILNIFDRYYLIIIDNTLTRVRRCSRQSANLRSSSQCITPSKHRPNFI